MKSGDILRAIAMQFLLPVSELIYKRKFVLAAATLISLAGSGQVTSKSCANSASSVAERGVTLASEGRCREALPLLRKSVAQNRGIEHENWQTPPASSGVVQLSYIPYFIRRTVAAAVGWS